MLGRVDSAAFHTKSAEDRRTSSYTPAASFRQFSIHNKINHNYVFGDKIGIYNKNGTTLKA